MKPQLSLSLGKAALGILLGRGRAFGGPVVAAMQLTNRCNLNCIHCFFYSPLVAVPLFQPLRKARNVGGEQPTLEEMVQLRRMDADFDVLQCAIDDLLAMGTRWFYISGGGEVFLHSGYLGLLERLKKTGSYCSTTTNGTRLTPDVVDELLRIGMDELRVTTMAGTAVAYASTHPGARPQTFHEVEQGLRLLSAEKARRGLKKPRLTLITVVVTQNWDGIADFAAFAGEVGAQQVLINPVYDVADCGLAGVIPTPEDVLGLRDQLAKAEAILADRGIAHNIPLFRKVCDGQCNTSNIYHHIPCYAGWLSIYIRTDGDVHPCCRCSKPFGNVHKHSIREIWHSDEYRRFRKRALKIVTNGPPAGCDCGHCNNHTRNLKTFEALHPFPGRPIRSRLPDILGS